MPKRKSNLSRKTSAARATALVRGQESPLVTALRLFNQAKRARDRRAAETPEQTANRRIQQANYVLSKRAAEKAKQKRAWLKELVQRQGTSSNAVILEQSQVRLQKQTQRQVRSRAAKKLVKAQHGEAELSSDSLRGVVALLDVCSEQRSLALKATLETLGAVVLSRESPLLTHLIWSQAGCCSAYNQDDAPDCKVLSPLWVDACAAGDTRLTKQSPHAASGEPDVPSAATLHNILKKIENENWQLSSRLPDLYDSPEDRKPALRILNNSFENYTVPTTESDMVEIEIQIQ